MNTAGKKSNVVTLRNGAFLNECESDLKAAKPWSEEKTHTMFLLSQYIKNPAMSVSHRMRALDMIAEYSDMAQALAEAGYSRTITVSKIERQNLEDVGANKINWTTCC
jgi:hypothetical protein